MKLWEEFLRIMEKELGRDTVEKWLRPLLVVRFDAGNLYLEAQNTFQIIWFEEHIRKRIPKGIATGSERPVRVHLALGTPLPAQNQNRSKRIVGSPQEGSHHRPLSYTSLPLDETATLASFIETKGNLLARKVVDQILQGDGSFNPLYLVGPTGSGKTHLLQAIARASQIANKKVLYTHAETFTDHLVSALRATDMAACRDAYRSCDILLVDDVHIFSKKSATQEEFFHTFNTLHVEGKQIVVSSSFTPQELSHIEPRLVSRFEWGIVVPLQPLEKKDYPEVLKRKMGALGASLPPRLSSYLIDLFQSSPKALVKALNTLLLRTRGGDEIQLEGLSSLGLKKNLSDLVQEEEKHHVTPPKVLSTVAEHFGLRIEDLTGKGQSRDLLLPRQMAMYICREILKLPYTKIGDLFQRDHSTVMSALKQLQKELLSNVSEVPSHLQSVFKKLHL
jgi:chromosomal replication initiator protein